MKGTPRKTLRNRKIYSLRKKGMSCFRIGVMYRISRQRVQQICLAQERA